MKFEYDDNKSKSNKVKHGIDFVEAQELWHDPFAFEIPSLNSKNENRFLVLVKLIQKIGQQ